MPRESLEAPENLRKERRRQVALGWLAENGGLPRGEIVRRLREEQGYAGAKSAVYELVRRLRRVVVVPLVRFEGVAGE